MYVWGLCVSSKITSVVVRLKISFRFISIISGQSGWKNKAQCSICHAESSGASLELVTKNILETQHDGHAADVVHTPTCNNKQKVQRLMCHESFLTAAVVSVFSHFISSTFLFLSVTLHMGRRWSSWKGNSLGKCHRLLVLFISYVIGNSLIYNFCSNNISAGLKGMSQRLLSTIEYYVIEVVLTFCFYHSIMSHQNGETGSKTKHLGRTAARLHCDVLRNWWR